MSHLSGRFATVAFALGSGCLPWPVSAQGLPFHTETALTTAFEGRGLRFFTMYNPRDSVTALVTPLILLPYAPHARVTTKVVLPLVFKRLTSPGTREGTRFSEVGIGDLSVAAKWAFLVRNRPGGTTRLALAADVAFPTGSTRRSFQDGPVAPRPLQLGSGAVGGSLTAVGTLIRGQWGVSADVGHRRHAAGEGFQFGPKTRYDLAVSLRLPARVERIRTRTWQFYLEWNGSHSEQNEMDGVDVPDSGGDLAFLSPGIQWTLLPQLLVEASVQFPVIQDPNGSQSDSGARPAIGLRYLFF